MRKSFSFLILFLKKSLSKVMCGFLPLKEVIKLHGALLSQSVSDTDTPIVKQTGVYSK